ncbi:MAG TPA: DUF1801 domain-containing protein [Bryobacteraceae bacterium]|jgi:uncharacterized protein YdhG (YjbR/CyaY superfamily)
MAKADYQSVDEYIASQPEDVRPILERVRTAIHEAVPEAEEVISYKMPTYKMPGGPVLYFAAWKQHYSLYPATGRVIAAFQDELAAYELNNSTIRFPLSQPVPVKLIGRIARFRSKEVADRKNAKTAEAKRR